MKHFLDKGWKIITVKKEKMKNCEYAKYETYIRPIMQQRAECPQSLEERLGERWKYENQLQGEVCCNLRVSKGEEGEKGFKCDGQVKNS